VRNFSRAIGILSAMCSRHPGVPVRRGRILGVFADHGASARGLVLEVWRASYEQFGQEGVMSTRGAVRTQLERRLAGLLRRVGTIEGDLKQAHDPDSQERATELENDEVLEGLDEMTLDEIRQIRIALRHIEDGNYGTCSTCGRPIGSARLAAVPSAITCVACAR
jgi:DnaK suppressor protein